MEDWNKCFLPSGFHVEFGLALAFNSYTVNTYLFRNCLSRGRRFSKRYEIFVARLCNNLYQHEKSPSSRSREISQIKCGYRFPTCFLHTSHVSGFAALFLFRSWISQNSWLSWRIKYVAPKKLAVYVHVWADLFLTFQPSEQTRSLK